MAQAVKLEPRADLLRGGPGDDLELFRELAQGADGLAAEPKRGDPLQVVEGGQLGRVVLEGEGAVVLLLSRESRRLPCLILRCELSCDSQEMCDSETS